VSKLKEEQDKLYKMAPKLVSYGNITCDLCGSLTDLGETGSEVSLFMSPNGTKNYYHVCADCLNKRMDVHNLHDMYPNEDREYWKQLYKNRKKRNPLNSFYDLCTSCFIHGNDLQIFVNEKDIPEDYIRGHIGYLRITEDEDQYVSINGNMCQTETTELHYAIDLTVFGTSMKVCPGRGSVLCSDCRFKKKE
jgi:hypothetical protein